MAPDNSSPLPITSVTQSHMVDGATAIAALIQFVICVVGLFLYALTCWMMIKHRKSTFSNPFYSLAIAIAAPDSLLLCMQLVCAIPSVFIGYENFSSTYMAACGFLADVAYWCLAPMMLVIGVNRYFAVCHFQSYKIIFSPARVRGLVACCWALGFSVPSLMYGCTCFYLFKEEAWTFDCSGGCADLALTINTIVSSLLTISVALIYTLTFVRYKLIQRRMSHKPKGTTNTTKTPGGNQQDPVRQSKKEAALMFQFALISSVLVIYIASFWLVTYFWQSRYGAMFLNLFVTLNSCVSPVLYLSFGSEFRRRLPWRNRVANGQQSTAAAGSAGGGGGGGTTTKPTNVVRVIGKA